MSRGVGVTSTWSWSGLGAIDGSAIVGAPPAVAPLANSMSLSFSDSLTSQAVNKRFLTLSAACFPFWADRCLFHLIAATFSVVFLS